MATAQSNMEYVGLSSRVGCPACRVSCPRMGYPMPTFLRTLELLWANIMPAPHCLLTVNARKLNAGIFNLSCAPLTKPNTWEEQGAGPADPSLQACLHCIFTLCPYVTVFQSKPLSPCSVWPHSLLRQARLLRQCHLLLTLIWLSWHLHTAISLGFSSTAIGLAYSLYFPANLLSSSLSVPSAAAARSH